MTTCLNCDQPITANFCPECGQKKFKRIDRKYLVDELQYSLVHTNKGFFYTVKKILSNPGKTAREFIEGNRVNHYKPILLVFLLAGISTFLSYKVVGLNEIMRDFYTEKFKMEQGSADKILSFLASYSTALYVILIPIFSIFSKIAFWKWGQNYYEHVIMNTFGTCFYILIYILLVYPLLYLFRHDSAAAIAIVTYSMIILPPILFWFYNEYYKEKSWKTVALRILLIIFLAFVTYLIIIIGIVIVLLILHGPEGLRQFAPPKT